MSESRYGRQFDSLADRWAALEGEHDLVHPDRGECGGVGGCAMMRHAHDLRVQMTDVLERWRKGASPVPGATELHRGRAEGGPWHGITLSANLDVWASVDGESGEYRWDAESAKWMWRDGAPPVPQAPELIDGDGDRFVRVGPDAYIIKGMSTGTTYTRAEIDSYGDRDTVEVWE